MQILETLARAQGGTLVANLAKSYGLDPNQAAAAFNAILPQLAAGIERNTLNRGGIADLVKAIGDGHHAQYLDRPELIGTQAMVADGNEILSHILGSRDASRAVADRAAASSGLGSALIRQLLPIIAAMLMGALSRQTGGGLGDILKRLPTGSDGRPQIPSSGDLGDILKRIPGLPGSRDGSGAPSGGGGIQLPDGLPGGLGDVLGKLGIPTGDSEAPAPRSAPQPTSRRATTDPSNPLPLPDRIPGINAPADRGPNPLDDLSDVVRRGAPSMSPSAGPLGNVIRDILGGVLGFQNKGVLSWLFSLIVTRWGWSILKRVLGMGR